MNANTKLQITELG